MLMNRCLRFSVLVSMILLASAAVATADIIKDLTVNLMLVPCSCNYGVGYFGGEDGGWPAWGNADFTSVAPWTFSFVTARPLFWQIGEDDGSYFARFGYGGFFSMTGPDGLTFSGTVTSGQSGWEGFNATVDVTFVGQWSNGLYGGGDAELFFGPIGYESDLNTYVAPEPSSIVLMAAGILGIWSTGKRSWRKI